MKIFLNLFSSKLKSGTLFISKTFISSFENKLSMALNAHKTKEAERIGNKQSYKSRYNGRWKKRQWESNIENDVERLPEKRANFKPEDRIKKKKTVILLGYSGANYLGMQRNPGQKTIEEDLFVAMLKNKWIDEDGFNTPQQIQFQRAARTDKFVSAARQTCSVKLPENIDIKSINSDLPDQIRIFAVKRVTKGFNSKDQCNARTYAYTLPTFAFAHHDCKVEMENFRTQKDTVNKLNEILKLFHGTKNFHNFTSRKEYLDPSSKRYIMSFSCGDPFLVEDVEFATIRIKGQSFMMHQIRKMIGLTLAVLRGLTNIETIDKAFTDQRIDIPMAPGLGLVLDEVHYDRYNERYGSDGIHEPLTWEREEPEIKEFVVKYINSTIFTTELKEKPMQLWLETLGWHSYDVRDEEKCIANKDDVRDEEKCIANEDDVRDEEKCIANEDKKNVIPTTTENSLV